MDLMLITNNPEIAKEAEDSGVERVFIDLEKSGKLERQGHLNTFISDHTIEDVKQIKKVVHTSKILVRVNPYNRDTQDEIDECIEAGADIIMLPMFKTRKEVQEFLKCINGRAKACLLLETSQAMVRIDEILELEGIDEIHIGLNDLHLSLGLDFMFEPLSGGIIEYLAYKIKKKNIRMGFGGLAKIGEGVIPAEMILGEHYRLKSEMVILSRTFRNEVRGISQGIKVNFDSEIRKIRDCELEIKKWTTQDFCNNQQEIQRRVRSVVDGINDGK